MKCAPDKISALVDGDLSPREAKRVEAHLESCAACEKARRELVQLKRALAAEAERVPERDPSRGDGWAELAARLGPSGAPQKTRARWMWAPAVALGFAAAILLVQRQLRPRGPSDDQLVAQAEDEFRRADQQYQHAVENLQKVVEHHPPKDAAAQARFLAAQARLAAAVEECRRTAHARPADADAEQLLFAAYRQQIDFYERQLMEARQ